MIDSEESPIDNSPIKSWLFQNIATVLLTITIALSSLVWQDLVVSMENMRTDIRDLTSKINTVVENQASYSTMIQSNKADIRDIEARLRELDRNWRDQWQNNANNQTENPNR